MANTSPSRRVLEGEVLITEFDPNDLEALEADLEEFVDLDEDEELYVSMPNGDRLDVRKLRERDGA